jgi:hypothetical protein
VVWFIFPRIRDWGGELASMFAVSCWRRPGGVSQAPDTRAQAECARMVNQVKGNSIDRIFRLPTISVSVFDDPVRPGRAQQPGLRRGSAEAFRRRTILRRSSGLWHAKRYRPRRGFIGRLRRLGSPYQFSVALRHQWCCREAS